MTPNPAGTTIRSRHPSSVRPRLTLAALAVLAVAGLAASGVLAAPPEKYAGTWRIESADSLEQQGLFHFFYLHPSGVFFLAAEWPGHENSRFAGTWSVTGDKLYLAGKGDVETNQGHWKVDYNRTFKIQVHDTGYRITPVPEKNRFGMMGWPNPFLYYRSQPVPNLPVLDLIPDEKAILERIYELVPGTRPKG